jgi:glycosyltransferase involved in cell wall biosynthesis
MRDEFLVGIDASRSYRSPMTGTERYSRRVLEHLVRLEADGLNFRFYFNEPPPIEAQLDGAETRHLPAQRFWTHYRLSRELKADPVDLLFVPSHVLPLYHPARSVVTVHDLGFLYEPDSHTRFSRLQLRLTTGWNARRATHLIAISESTKQDLVQHSKVDPERITVVPHGVDDQFQVLPEDNVERYRRAARLPARFLLYVGTIQPRKNLLKLISAFERVTAVDDDLQLVLAGRPGWMSKPIQERARVSPLAHRIKLLGYVPDQQLPLLYSAAAAFTLPSLYEGFGLPVLEALACGTPVIMSNRGALPELVGADSEVVDPTDVGAIAEAVLAAIQRQREPDLVQQRREFAAQFTWQSSAQKTRDVLWKVLHQ